MTANNILQLAAIIVAAVWVPLLAVLAFMYRKLSTHDVALALVVQAVNGSGDQPSLRTLITQVQIEQTVQARTLAATAVAVTPATTVNVHEPTKEGSQP